MAAEASVESVDYEAKSKTFMEENEKLKLALAEVRKHRKGSGPKMIE